MAATAAFWSATAVVVAPDAATTTASNAGAPVVRERGGREAPVRGTTVDYGNVITSNFQPHRAQIRA